MNDGGVVFYGGETNWGPDSDNGPVAGAKQITDASRTTAPTHVGTVITDQPPVMLYDRPYEEVIRAAKRSLAVADRATPVMHYAALVVIVLVILGLVALLVIRWRRARRRKIE